MKIPTVHSNGTSKDELLQLQLDAKNAVLKAIKKVQQAAPHPRDFYVQDTGAFNLASREHEMRLVQLHEVADELNTIAEGIYGQGR